MGLECEGIPEVFENLKQQLGDCEARNKMLDFVLLSGGNTKVQNFDERIKRELTMNYPVNTQINVVRSFDAELDAWHGGA